MPNLDKLIRCPACYYDLGVPPVEPVNGKWQPPSLRLEVASGPAGNRQWRLSLFGAGRGTELGPWTSDEFIPNEVRWVYRMCGDGHVFLDHLNLATRNPEWTVEGFDVAAAIGPIAAGKSYLVLRTLNQNLAIGHIDAGPPPEPRRVSTHRVGGLEGEPDRYLMNQYRRMAVDGNPLEPTLLDETLPFSFLDAQVGNKIVAKIFDIHREVTGSDAYVDRRSWGRRMRQPIVKRYHIGTRRVLTATADLAGEMFHRQLDDEDHQRRTLREYGTLLWVIDAAITQQFRDFMPTDMRDQVMPASTRLGSTAGDIADRRSVQHELADVLAQVDGWPSGPVGGTQHTLPCITKADLIHLCLRKGKHLSELGRPGDVVDGATTYLLDIARRPTGLLADEVTRNIVAPLHARRHQRAGQRNYARHIATALVDWYSNPDEFWKLVHLGGPATITYRAGIPAAQYPAGRIPVDEIGRHLALSLVEGQGGVLRIRDTVMSAIGCGLAFGLGFRHPIDAMMAQDWRELRFYLCSPLVEVPTQAPDGSGVMTPLDDTHSFPDKGDRSAGLTQLLLSILRRLL